MLLLWKGNRTRDGEDVRKKRWEHPLLLLNKVREKLLTGKAALAGALGAILILFLSGCVQPPQVCYIGDPGPLKPILEKHGVIPDNNLEACTDFVIFQENVPRYKMERVVQRLKLGGNAILVFWGGYRSGSVYWWASYDVFPVTPPNPDYPEVHRYRVRGKLHSPYGYPQEEKEYELLAVVPRRGTEIVGYVVDHNAYEPAIAMRTNLGGRVWHFLYDASLTPHVFEKVLVEITGS